MVLMELNDETIIFRKLWRHNKKIMKLTQRSVFKPAFRAPDVAQYNQPPGICTPHVQPLRILLGNRIFSHEKLLPVTESVYRGEGGTCPPVKINDVQLPQSDQVKYLVLHLDRRLTWHKHIFTKRKQLGLTLTKMHLFSDESPNSPPPTNYYSIK
jgi:hypothetical protein